MQGQPEGQGPAPRERDWTDRDAEHICARYRAIGRVCKRHRIASERGETRPSLCGGEGL